MRRSMRSSLLLAIAGALGISASWGQDDAFDRTPTDCVSVSRIRRTEVLDDRTILFHLRGRSVYRNFLPRECPGLLQAGRFMYATRTSRLCDIDYITVLEQLGGGFQEGFRCALGPFYPISVEEAEDLKRIAKEGDDGSGAIDVETVELPKDESPEGGDPATEDR